MVYQTNNFINTSFCWLVVYLPLCKILVSWDCYSQYMETTKFMFQTTNQLVFFFALMGPFAGNMFSTFFLHPDLKSPQVPAVLKQETIMKRTDPSQDQDDVGQDDLRQCPHHPVDPGTTRMTPNDSKIEIHSMDLLL